jgi:ATP-binding cassette subfamily B protein
MSPRPTERLRFFSHLQRLSFDTLDRRRLGDLLARLGGDIQAIESFVLGGLGEVISAIARITFFAGALFLLDWQLALYALVLAPPFYLAARFFARLARQAARAKRRRSGALSAVAEESIANAALVQSFNATDHERRRLLREGEGVVDAELVSARVAGAFSGLVALVEVAGLLALITFGTWAVQDGRLTIGGLLAFLAYLTQLLRPVGDLSQLAATLLAAGAGGERVLELLDRRPLVGERPGARSLERARGSIELDDVTFTYPDTSEPVLRGLTLSAEPGEVVALTGPSGCGKSTAARLLLRFADPDEGVAKLDGIDLRELDLASVRDNVALLLQETMLFDSTVRENIAFGRPATSQAEIEAAARSAGAHEFVARLPEGYETRVGQRGRILSGGQRRRVEIARTLLRDAPVVVLDEPTTGLDSDTAQRLIEPLRALLAGRTAVLITHDPQLLRYADRVIRLQPARVPTAC